MQKYLKAFFGAASSGIVAAQFALADNVISTSEYLGIAAAVIGTFSVVWGVPNKGD